jgi:hypothetical protein
MMTKNHVVVVVGILVRIGARASRASCSRMSQSDIGIYRKQAINQALL